MNRPVGVTIIAILYFLGAILCVLGGIGMMVGGGFIATLIGQQGGQGSAAGAGVFAGLGVVMGVFFLILAIIPLVVGLGLWKLKEWGRILAIAVSAISAVLQLFGVVGMLLHFSVGGFAFLVCRLAISVLIVWYLLKPEVKAAFQSARATTAAA